MSTKRTMKMSGLYRQMEFISECISKLTETEIGECLDKAYKSINSGDKKVISGICTDIQSKCHAKNKTIQIGEISSRLIIVWLYTWLIQYGITMELLSTKTDAFAEYIILKGFFSDIEFEN